MKTISFKQILQNCSKNKKVERKRSLRKNSFQFIVSKVVGYQIEIQFLLLLNKDFKQPKKEIYSYQRTSIKLQF